MLSRHHQDTNPATHPIFPLILRDVCFEVGGNIDHVTRVMTTTIALETSKGNLPLALGLGIILLCLTFMVNVAAMAIRDVAKRVYG